MPLDAIIYSAMALVAAGVVKGATGLGLPLVSLPVLLHFVSPPVAVVMLATCTIVSNGVLVRLGWSYLVQDRPLKFAMLGMAIGAGLGTLFLVNAGEDAVRRCLGGLMIAFVLLRLWRPSPWLAAGYSPGFGLVVGLAGGGLQGGLGAGAPVVAIFASALGLDQSRYVLCVSALYLAGAVVQVPALLYFGELSPGIMALSLAAVLPAMAGVWIGVRLGRRLDRKTFTAAVLVLIAASGLALIFT